MIPVAQSSRHAFLDQCAAIRTGRLRLITPEGTRHCFGASGPEAELTLHDWSALSGARSRGRAGWYAGFANGLWETPSVEDLARVALANHQTQPRSRAWPAWRRTRRPALRLPRMDNDFFLAWLDRSMTATSGLFDTGAGDLEAAQSAKNARILAQLGPDPDVLEVGCGWGSFTEAAAEAGRDVVALETVPARKAWAVARLDGRAEIRARRLEDEAGQFANIVAVETPDVLPGLAARLAPGGRAVVQVVETAAEASADPVSQQARRHGLRVVDSHSFGASYARTFRHWARRLRAGSARLAGQGHDPRHIRLWRCHVEASAADYALGRRTVIQLTLAHA